jgi:hypothetical protein
MVFVDAFQDNVFDPVGQGDVGLDGVEVSLYRLNAANEYELVATTTTVGGAYSFTGLAAGTYRIAAAQLEEYNNQQLTDSTDYLGSLGGELEDDAFAGIVVGAGQTGTGYNFTEMFA